VSRVQYGRLAEIALSQNFIHFQKIPIGFSDIFPKQLGILVQILQAYYMFLSTLDYIFYSIICKFDEVMPY